MDNKNGKKYIVFILAFVLVLICSVPAFASNEYQYNDVRIFIDGVASGWGHLYSDTVQSVGSTTYFVPYINNGYIWLRMKDGTGVNTGVAYSPTSFTTVYATQSGTDLSISRQGSAYIISYTLDSNYTDIYLYIDTTSFTLDDPSPYVEENFIKWNTIEHSTGYGIRYCSTQNGLYETVVSSYDGSSYAPTKTGWYTVRALGGGLYASSTWSDPIYFNLAEAGGITTIGGIVDWFQSLLATITEKLDSISGTWSNFTATVQLLLGDIFNMIPSSIQTIGIASFVIACVLGVIKHIL